MIVGVDSSGLVLRTPMVIVGVARAVGGKNLRHHRTRMPARTVARRGERKPGPVGWRRSSWILGASIKLLSRHRRRSGSGGTGHAYI